MKLKKISREINKRPILSTSLKIFWWLLILIFGFFLNDFYHDFKVKPSVELIIPQTHNNHGNFVFTFINGEVELNEVYIKIQSPQMKTSWKPYPIGKFPKNYPYELDFFDEKTLNVSQKINCIDNPFDNLEFGRAYLGLYKNKTSGALVMPRQNVTFYTCQYDTWKIEFISDKFNKTFSKQMYMPVSYGIETDGIGEYVDSSSPEIEKDSDLIWSIYDKRALDFSEEMSEQNGI